MERRGVCALVSQRGVEGTARVARAFLKQSKRVRLGMTDGIKEAVPRVLRTLWDLEVELRSAAQNSVVLRKDEAREHLAGARRHFDDLIGIIRSSEGGAAAPPTTDPRRSDIEKQN